MPSLDQARQFSGHNHFIDDVCLVGIEIDRLLGQTHLSHRRLQDRNHFSSSTEVSDQVWNFSPGGHGGIFFPDALRRNSSAKAWLSPCRKDAASPRSPAA